MTDALKRRIGLPLLVTYGVGVMVGAGIYVLVGAVAGQAGIWAPLSFAIAGLVAAPTALSYAELSARIPEAAGESAYVEEGLGLHGLAVLIGLAIVAAGTISSAAVLRGGTGYLLGLIDWPFAWVIVALGLILTLIAIAGVLESLAFAGLLTLVEVVGLGLVIWAGFSVESHVDWSATPPAWAGVGIAASLAFFAFIGFEDIVNMAEEVRDPARTLPRAIILSLAITTGLYMLVSVAAIRAVPPDMLAATERPLALVWEAGTGRAAAFLSIIAVLAALNGALAQIVMAARVLFGLGKRSPALAVFHRAHGRLGTPVLATVLVGVAMVGAALVLPVADLAEMTSLILLAVFVVVNMSLIRLKARVPQAPFRVPVWVPWAGLLAALAAVALSVGGMI